ncbi:hypothetical protein EC973_007278, partial [Apophysomyces ossiformis]
NTTFQQQLDRESLEVNAHVLKRHAACLHEITQKISRFTLEKIAAKLDFYLSADKTSECSCAMKLIYNLPCRHILPAWGPIPLDSVPRRWHLFPLKESEAPLDETVAQTASETALVKVSNFDLVKQISSEFYCLVELESKLHDHQQMGVLLQHLKSIKDELF